MANAELRTLAKKSGVPLWKVAQELKISEPTMTRKLRNELSTRDSATIKDIIKRLSCEVSK